MRDSYCVNPLLVSVENWILNCFRVDTTLTLEGIKEVRAGEPANFLVAWLRLLTFFPSGSGSWFLFQAAPALAPMSQKHPAPAPQP